MFLKKNLGTKADIQSALAIYNFNEDFLIHHIGKNSIDEEFLQRELQEMEEHEFSSNFIVYEEKKVGIIDFMLQENGYVYLSLMMLGADKQKAGMGRLIYQDFEQQMIEKGARIIRIDVVSDHEPNVIPFWEKMGFHGKRKDRLTWGEKTSTVLVMEKRLV